MAGRAKALSERDLKLLVGFAFFAEVVAVYMLLLDGPLTALGRVNRQLAETKAANAAVHEAVDRRGVHRPKADAAARPVSIERKPGESPSVAIQRYMARMTAVCHLESLSLEVPPPPVPTATEPAPPVPTYAATLKVRGTYEAISEFVGWMGQPEYQSSLDQVVVRSQAASPQLLEAEVHVSFFITAPAPTLRKG